MILTRTMREEYYDHYPQFTGEAADVQGHAVVCLLHSQMIKLNKP